MQGGEANRNVHAGRRRLQSVGYPVATTQSLMCKPYNFSLSLANSDGSPFSSTAVSSLVGPVANYIVPLKESVTNGSYAGTGYTCAPTYSLGRCQLLLQDRFAFCTTWAWWTIPNLSSATCSNTSYTYMCSTGVYLAAQKEISQCEVWAHYYGDGNASSINSGCALLAKGPVGRRRLSQDLVEEVEIFAEVDEPLFGPEEEPTPYPNIPQPGPESPTPVSPDPLFGPRFTGDGGDVGLGYESSCFFGCIAALDTCLASSNAAGIFSQIIVILCCAEYTLCLDLCLEGVGFITLPNAGVCG